MFSLDRNRNDTSLSLDLLRAIAAQMVCVGHATNFGHVGYTLVPELGVLLFFILSGFVIAYTLQTKSAVSDYDLIAYGIDRVCRIYSAYLPALVLFALVEHGLRWHGIAASADAGPISLFNWLGNVAMMQLYPGDIAFPQFGMSGQTSSIAVEFHIYFFVGAIYFFCIGRQRVLAVVVAIISAREPLGYFLSMSGRALFALWLIGFAIYFIVRSIGSDKATALGFCAIAAGVIFRWRIFEQPSDVYNVANFPGLAFGFAALVMVTQQSRLLGPVASVIRFFAGYSLTLFLTHLVLIRAIYLLWPDGGWPETILALIGVNIFAAVFAQLTEVHYRTLAKAIHRFRGGTPVVVGDASEAQPWAPDRL